MNCNNCGRELTTPPVWCQCGQDFRHGDSRTRRRVADRCLTREEFCAALLRLSTRGFRWYDDVGLIRKYRNIVEGAVAITMFCLLAAVEIRDWEQGLIIPRTLLSAFLVLAWVGSAQILVSSFSSYDLRTWKWAPEPTLALVFVSGVVLGYAVSRHPFLASSPALVLATAVAVAFAVGMSFYLLLRAMERRRARTGAYADCKHRLFEGASDSFQAAAQPQEPAQATPDVVRWYHVLVALLLFHVAPAWGVVKVMRGQRRSGLFLIIVPLIVAVLLALAVLTAIRARG
jgi:hypothetical protein